MTKPRDRIDDALDGFSSRELEDLVRRAGLRLRACVMCGEPGGDAATITRGNTRATIVVCPACFERYRLPERRA